MKSKNIIVIGASSGGFEALKVLVAGLPKDLPASIFIVWHMSPRVSGVLPTVFNRLNSMTAAHGFDHEQIEVGRIYVAPPDRHMLIDDGQIRVTRGPKENRFRPAIDPLFRSAAYHHSSDVMGVILSGALDDGTSGLWTIKHRGGIAIVQDPNDAEVSSMPESAIREVEVDHILPVADIPMLLTKLVEERERRPHLKVVSSTAGDRESDRLKLEIDIAAAESSDIGMDIMKFGKLSPYTCPECHGVLSLLQDGSITRYRCHTGHAFAVDSLLATITEKIESSVWSAIRGVDESIVLLNHIGDHFAEQNEPRLAAQYFQKAAEAAERNEFLRKVVFSHEELSEESIREETESEELAGNAEQELSARADH